MSTHKPDDDREFDAFLKGDHELSREYHRKADDAVPDSLDAMILRQAAEQAARQQRLNEPAEKAPWYRSSWFAPASGLAIAAMVTVVMFYPAQVPLQQSESARMQDLMLEEAPARKLMRAPAAPETAERAEADMAVAFEPPPAPAIAMHDAVGNMAGAAESEMRADAAPAEAGMLEELQIAARQDAFEAKAMQAAPAPASLAMERQLAKREKPAMNPEWDLLKALEARDWAAVIDYLDGLPVPTEEIAAHIQHIRIAAEQQQLPEQDDLQALYDWLQHHHPQEIAHDRQTTGD